MKVPSPLEYLDYRAWLKDAYLARKQANRHFSYRFMAERLEVDAGQLVRILQGRLHLPDRALPRAVRLFSLEAREGDYLEELMGFARAKGRRETSATFDRLMELKGLDARTTDDRHAAFYLESHHAVVRGLLGIARVRDDYEALGRMCDPPIPAEAAERSVRLLEELGMARRDERGVWGLTDRHLVQGGDVPRQVVRKFQADVLRLAERALDEVPPSQREISTQTVALGAQDLETVREWTGDLWRRIQRLAQTSPAPDRICHVGMLVVPAGRSRPRPAG